MTKEYVEQLLQLEVTPTAYEDTLLLLPNRR